MRKSIWIAAFALSLAACAGVLGLRTKAGPRPFEHRAHVLNGIGCLRCHKGVNEAGDTGPLHLPTAESCTAGGCHEKPHDKRDCMQCHGVPGTRERREQDRKYLRFQHKTHYKRVYGNCARCHSEIERDSAQLYARVGACLSCHQHEKQFEVDDCDACHTDLAFENRPPASHMVHGDDFLHEHGVRARGARDICATCHSESFCASCHGVTTATLPSRMTFDRPLRAGVHRAGFRSRHGIEARVDPGLCTTCHSDQTCASCHLREGVAGPDARRGSPHPPGWASLVPGPQNEHGRAARRDPVACASCHSGAGEMLCEGCHKVGAPGGSPHPAGWSSRRSKRTDLPCVLCHKGGL